MKKVDASIPCFHCCRTLVFEDNDGQTVDLVCQNSCKQYRTQWTREEYNRFVAINEWKDRESRKWYVGTCVPQLPTLVECHYGYSIELIEPGECFEDFKKRLTAKLVEQGYYPCRHKVEPSFSQSSPW
ncbi:MAG: hypothetical protein HY225_00135 [Candidatus Vogelbacteria bacterium]|nr:hypothetical protein [Candidatus Vogelbacteria bacterium]